MQTGSLNRTNKMILLANKIQNSIDFASHEKRIPSLCWGLFYGWPQSFVIIIININSAQNKTIHKYKLK